MFCFPICLIQIAMFHGAVGAFRCAFYGFSDCFACVVAGEGILNRLYHLLTEADISAFVTDGLEDDLCLSFQFDHLPEVDVGLFPAPGVYENIPDLYAKGVGGFFFLWFFFGFFGSDFFGVAFNI